jgi:putative transcriptional regulator
MYKPIEVDKQNLTIMGIKFPNIEVLDSVANAIGSNMFEARQTPQSRRGNKSDCRNFAITQ